METKLITKILTDNDIKPSYARIQIYKYLSEFKNHPTVDEIYTHLVDQIPTLSKTTVYNTLNLFEEKELVLALSLDNLEKRYEIIDGNHMHFKCEICNMIYDIPCDNKNLLSQEYGNFKVNEQHIFLKGICENCNS